MLQLSDSIWQTTLNTDIHCDIVQHVGVSNYQYRYSHVLHCGVNSTSPMINVPVLAGALPPHIRFAISCLSDSEKQYYAHPILPYVSYKIYVGLLTIIHS